MQAGHMTVFMGVPTMYALLLAAYDSMSPEQQVSNFTLRGISLNSGLGTGNVCCLATTLPVFMVIADFNQPTTSCTGSFPPSRSHAFHYPMADLWLTSFIFLGFILHFRPRQLVVLLNCG